MLIGVDLDGTIEDSRDDMVAAAQRVRDSFGLDKRADQSLRPHVNGGMDALYRACFEDYQPDAADRLHVIQEAYDSDYLAHVAVKTQLYTGMGDTLRALATRGFLACVTNKPERISRKLLEQLGVGGEFATVVGGDSCAQAKPHPIMLETAAARCSFDRARGTAFMVGDTNADIQLARSYGAKAIWCAWGYVQRPSEAPDAKAQRPSELVRIIDDIIHGVTHGLVQ